MARQPRVVVGGLWCHALRAGHASTGSPYPAADGTVAPLELTLAASLPLGAARDGSDVAHGSHWLNMAAWSPPAPRLPTAVAFSPCGAVLAVGCSDGMVLLYAVGPWSVLAVLHAHDRAVTHLVWPATHLCDVLVSAGADCAVRRWRWMAADMTHEAALPTVPTALMHLVHGAADEGVTVVGCAAQPAVVVRWRDAHVWRLPLPVRDDAGDGDGDGNGSTTATVGTKRPRVDSQADADECISCLAVATADPAGADTPVGYGGTTHGRVAVLSWRQPAVAGVTGADAAAAEAAAACPIRVARTLELPTTSAVRSLHVMLPTPALAALQPPLRVPGHQPAPQSQSATSSGLGSGSDVTVLPLPTHGYHRLLVHTAGRQVLTVCSVTGRTLQVVEAPFASPTADHRIIAHQGLMHVAPACDGSTIMGLERSGSLYRLRSWHAALLPTPHHTPHLPLAHARANAAAAGVSPWGSDSVKRARTEAGPTSHRIPALHAGACLRLLVEGDEAEEPSVVVTAGHRVQHVKAGTGRGGTSGSGTGSGQRGRRKPGSAGGPPPEAPLKAPRVAHVRQLSLVEQPPPHVAVTAVATLEEHVTWDAAGIDTYRALSTTAATMTMAVHPHSPLVVVGTAAGAVSLIRPIVSTAWHVFSPLLGVPEVIVNIPMLHASRMRASAVAGAGDTSLSASQPTTSSLLLPSLDPLLGGINAGSAAGGSSAVASLGAEGDAVGATGRPATGASGPRNLYAGLSQAVDLLAPQHASPLPVCRGGRPPVHTASGSSLNAWLTAVVPDTSATAGGAVTLAEPTHATEGLPAAMASRLQRALAAAGTPAPPARVPYGSFVPVPLHAPTPATNDDKSAVSLARSATWPVPEMGGAVRWETAVTAVDRIAAGLADVPRMFPEPPNPSEADVVLALTEEGIRRIVSVTARDTPVTWVPMHTPVTADMVREAVVGGLDALVHMGTVPKSSRPPPTLGALPGTHDRLELVGMGGGPVNEVEAMITHLVTVNPTAAAAPPGPATGAPTAPGKAASALPPTAGRPAAAATVTATTTGAPSGRGGGAIGRGGGRGGGASARGKVMTTLYKAAAIKKRAQQSGPLFMG